MEGELTIDITGHDQERGKELSVISISGVVVHRQALVGPIQKINLSHLRPGIYMVWIRTGDTEIRQKLVKY